MNLREVTLLQTKFLGFETITEIFYKIVKVPVDMSFTTLY